MCNKKGTLSANADRGNRNKLGTFAFLFTFIFLACLKIPFTRPAPLSMRPKQPFHTCLSSFPRPLKIPSTSAKRPIQAV